MQRTSTHSLIRLLAYEISAILIWFCLYHSYLSFHLHIAQGDHGNNFYAFRRTLEGAVPYRDYWWVYGPLMPYYYSVFLRLFGVNMHSVLLGYHFLNLLCGLVFFAIIARNFPLYMALTAAIFYWVYSPHFAHTFNHLGGILAIFGMLYGIWTYIQTLKVKCLYLALGCVTLLAFIKLNFGLAMLGGTAGSVWLIDRIINVPPSASKRRFYFITIFLMPLVIALGYGLFLQGLPWDVVRQCILFLDTDPNRVEMVESLRRLSRYLKDLNMHLGLMPFNILSAFAAGYFLFLLRKKRIPRPLSAQITAGLVALVFLSLCSLHEFFPTGIEYRLFWLEPFRQLAMFMIFFVILMTFPMGVRLLTCLFLVLLPLGNHLMRYQFFESVKEYMPLNRGRIYIANSEPWLATVTDTTKFLNEHLAPQETFLALPSDQLYYFLTAHKLGFIIHGCFMIGAPGETKESARQTIDFAKSLPLDTIQVTGIATYPGTTMYKWAKENGYLLGKDWTDWLTAEGEQKTLLNYPQLSNKDIDRLIDQGLREFYLRPSQILRMLVSIRSWGDFLRKLYGLSAFLNYFLSKIFSGPRKKSY